MNQFDRVRRNTSGDFHQLDSKSKNGDPLFQAVKKE